MNTENPKLSESSKNGGEFPPQKPLEQIQAEHQENKRENSDKLTAFRIEEEKTQRMADIALCIENEWDYCGVEPKSEDTLQILGEIFYKKEQQRGADYDITRLPSKMAKKYAEKGMKDRVETKKVEAAASIDRKASAETADQAGEKVDSAENKTAFFEAIKNMKGDNVGKLNAIAQMTEKYPEEAVKAGKFLQILSIASANQQDSQIISQRLNQANFSKGVPDPVQFVRWAIFDNPDSQMQTGVSEATQNAVAAELGIVRNKYTIKSGEDILEAYKDGYAKETYLDENGKVQTRNIRLDEDHEVEYRDGQFLSQTATGTPILKAKTRGGNFFTKLPENARADDITQRALTMDFYGKLAELNMAEVLYERPSTERGGGQVELRFPQDYERTLKLAQILFGGTTGYDGDLLGQSDLDKIPYLLQFQNKRGDYVAGDIDPEAMKRDYREQGILEGSNEINWARFEEMISQNRNNIFTAPEQFSEVA